MKMISTKRAPAAIGPYSQAIFLEDLKLLYTSGQVPIDPASGEIISGGIKEQTHQVFKNLQAVLEEAGSDFTKVVKATVFMQNISDFAAVNEIYAQYFTQTLPARSAVEVAALPKGSLIEIELIAKV